ncbi:hypothetical protein QNM97_10485 [Gordonia sp. L191]|uniref:anthrone oxygenase family protein n=1 Tax=Gordonia sp. L191 TaxID=2982699 RepID=UPI0024C0519B|nr:anthrone oxygenase family protein [Gordonia sp. L191]WHU49360.1 hypothetical protein QNM97_10485 [Gordonia sp. L191]
MIMKTVIGSASILSATLAGFYFAYATVITAQGGVDGTDAMRRMNSAVERPPFLALFCLAPLLAVATAVWIVVAGPRDARGLAAVFGAVCAIAACVTTVAINVPLNQRLAAGSVEWATFTRTWGTWNVLRLWLSLLGAIGMGVAALR